MLIRTVSCAPIVAFLFAIGSPLKGAPALQKKANPEVDVRAEDGTVLIAAHQIRSYDWATHTLTLAPKVREELSARLRKSKPGALVKGIPFTVAVGGKSVYSLKFTTTLSSATIFDAPVIVVDLAGLDSTVRLDQLRIQLGYPGDPPFKVDDPRDDERIFDALKAAGKLAADVGWIRVIPSEKEGKVILYRPDGTARTDIKASPRGARSPDGKRIAYVNSTADETAVHIADADGTNARKVIDKRVFANSVPSWSPDGKQIAFVAAAADGNGQVHVVDQDGRNPRQVTDARFGAEYPTFSSNGRLAYLIWGERPGKNRSADLVIGEGADAKTVLKGAMLTTYAWSPDGKEIAYGKVGTLVFHEVASGKERAVTFGDIDKGLARYGITRLAWNPDGKAVVCKMTFWGGRMVVGDYTTFGDKEIFIIPRAGKPNWFVPGENVNEIDWISHKPREGR